MIGDILDRRNSDSLRAWRAKLAAGVRLPAIWPNLKQYEAWLSLEWKRLGTWAITHRRNERKPPALIGSPAYDRNWRPL